MDVKIRPDMEIRTHIGTKWSNSVLLGIVHYSYIPDPQILLYCRVS